MGHYFLDAQYIQGIKKKVGSEVISKGWIRNLLKGSDPDQN